MKAVAERKATRPIKPRTKIGGAVGLDGMDGAGAEGGPRVIVIKSHQKLRERDSAVVRYSVDSYGGGARAAGLKDFEKQR